MQSKNPHITYSWSSISAVLPYPWFPCILRSISSDLSNHDHTVLYVFTIEKNLSTSGPAQFKPELRVNCTYLSLMILILTAIILALSSASYPQLLQLVQHPSRLNVSLLLFFLKHILKASMPHYLKVGVPPIEWPSLPPFTQYQTFDALTFK